MRNAALITAGLMAAMLVATGCSSDKSVVSGAGSAAGNAASAANPASAGAGTSSGSAAGQSSSAAPAPASTGGSGGSGGGGGGGAVNVCSLLSPSQASSINKVTYSGSTPKAITNGYDECTYKNSGQHESPIDIQDLTVMVISISGCWTSLQSADGPGKTVAGVGDAAFGDSIGLDVKAGSRCVTISGLTIAELQNNYAPDTAMAKIILGNLH